MTRRNNIKPPALFRWLLLLTSSREEEFSISGDFEEIYQRIRIEDGLAKARLWYISQVIKTAPAVV